MPNVEEMVDARMMNSEVFVDGAVSVSDEGVDGHKSQDPLQRSS